MVNVLVVPVHPPKVMHLINLLASCNQPKCTTPILLVCTNNSEAQYIQSAVNASGCASNLQIQILDVENWCNSVLQDKKALDYLTSNANTCVVNFKKFAALHYACTQKWNFVALIDADALCTGSLDLFMNQCVHNYHTHKWLGCAVDNNSIGIGACTLSTAMLGSQAQNWCSSQNILNIYNWFLDPPSYLITHVQEFFEFVQTIHGSLTNFFMQTSWFTFDFLVYSQWLAYTGKARILDYSDKTGVNHVPEILNVSDMQMLRYHYGHKASWISTAAFLKDPQLCKQLMPESQMIYHTDRWTV